MRRLSKIAAVAAVSAVGLCASSAEAASITVSQDPGTTFTTTGFTGFSTFGDDMVGMLVTAFFSDGSSQTVAWAANGAGAGHAVGTGWSLSESGDTFNSNDPWTLINLRGAGIGMTGLLLDGAPGRTIFDRTNPNQGTPGSASGLDFTSSNIDSLDITATYRDLLAISPSAPVGDVFLRLDLRFTNAGGLGNDHTLSFSADTDNALTAVTPSAVPEPASLALLGSGLIVGIRRWRQRRGNQTAS